MYTNIEAQNLITVITTQCALLDSIIDTQKKIRQAVIGKSWEHLEADLFALDSLSRKFTEMETEREKFCGSGAESAEQIDFYGVIGKFPEDMRAQLYDAFTLLRHKLFTSKVENKGLGDYLRITRDFLQGVFDSAVPNRKSKVYSHTGALVNTAPESLVLNTLM